MKTTTTRKPAPKSTIASRAAPTAKRTTAATNGDSQLTAQYKKQVEELNEKLVGMEQSLESLEKVRFLALDLNSKITQYLGARFLLRKIERYRAYGD